MGRNRTIGFAIQKIMKIGETCGQLLVFHHQWFKHKMTHSPRTHCAFPAAVPSHVVLLVSREAASLATNVAGRKAARCFHLAFFGKIAYNGGLVKSQGEGACLTIMFLTLILFSITTWPVAFGEFRPSRPHKTHFAKPGKRDNHMYTSWKLHATWFGKNAARSSRPRREFKSWNVLALVSDQTFEPPPKKITCSRSRKFFVFVQTPHRSTSILHSWKWKGLAK